MVLLVFLIVIWRMITRRRSYIYRYCMKGRWKMCTKHSIKKRRKKMCNRRNSRKEGYFVEGGISLGGSKEMFGCQHLMKILFLIRCDYNSER
jgi:hypothetical protein